MTRTTWIRWTAALAIGVAAVLTSGRTSLRAEEARIVTITARRFEFEPKEITLKRGEPVRLQLRSEDVRHGFFSKPLGIDADIAPGKTTEVVVTPMTPGRYSTICDHFCGRGHGNMKMTIVVD